jgi:hypothetical protein
LEVMRGESWRRHRGMETLSTLFLSHEHLHHLLVPSTLVDIYTSSIEILSSAWRRNVNKPLICAIDG